MLNLPKLFLLSCSNAREVDGLRNAMRANIHPVKNENGDIRPTDEDSYIAIALTSVETKLLESIILDKVKKN